ncbi:helix-turn-helix transcriptional regulator [Uliginosibacterium sediminicola]|uniref:Helix-turn-helix transcriptional regulator n=1 Tax=Uliginosibacterium sediminicola TaxID=2024550 RepID=A0ABU9YW05_9RHOO
MRKEQVVPLSKADQFAVVKIIGSRMREARELCGLSVTTAAERLGYKNPSKLSKIENSTDTISVPVWTIRRAAEVYEVSCDYLFGLSSDWEVGARADQERGVSQWMFDAWEAARRRDMETLKKLHDRVQAMNEVIGQMLASGEATAAALARFKELNPSFEDMRGSATLTAKIEAGLTAAKAAQIKMVRFRVECSVSARSESTQLPLFL